MHKKCTNLYFAYKTRCNDKWKWRKSISPIFSFSYTWPHFCTTWRSWPPSFGWSPTPRFLDNGQTPPWVLYPQSEHQSEVHAFVYLPQERGFYRFISNLQTVNIQATIVESCVYLKGDNVLYWAVLVPDVLDAAVSASPVILVRFKNNTNLTGVLRPWNGPVPTWVVKENCVLIIADNTNLDQGSRFKLSS